MNQSGFQTYVKRFIAKGYVGDLVQLPYANPTAVYPKDVITVGKGTWLVSGDDIVYGSNVKGSNTVFLGICARTNQGAMGSFDSYEYGNSLDITGTNPASIIYTGTMLVQILDSFRTDKTIKTNDIIYVSDLTGDLVVGVTTQQNYTKTNFSVLKAGTIGTVEVGELSTITGVSSQNANALI